MEALESVKSRFYATPANQFAEHRGMLDGRSKRGGKKQRYSAYIAKVFDKTGMSWPYCTKEEIHVIHVYCLCGFGRLDGWACLSHRDGQVAIYRAADKRAG